MMMMKNITFVTLLAFLANLTSVIANSFEQTNEVETTGAPCLFDICCEGNQVDKHVLVVN